MNIIGVLSQNFVRVCSNRIFTNAAVCHAKLSHGHVIQVHPIRAEFVCRQSRAVCNNRNVTRAAVWHAKLLHAYIVQLCRTRPKGGGTSDHTEKKGGGVFCHTIGVAKGSFPRSLYIYLDILSAPLPPGDLITHSTKHSLPNAMSLCEYRPQMSGWEHDQINPQTISVFLVPSWHIYKWFTIWPIA